MRKVLFVGFAILLAISLAGCTIFRMPGATVKGVVMFDPVTPAANAKITFTPASDYGSSIVGYANSSGVWSTENMAVKPDAYTIKFEHPDAGQPSTITYKVCLPFKTYDVGTVYLWDEEAEDLVTVNGVVLDDDDPYDPVPDATVTFVYQGTPAYTIIVTTNADGEFQVPGMVAGIYDITISKLGYADTFMDDEDLSSPENDLGELTLIDP